MSGARLTGRRRGYSPAEATTTLTKLGENVTSTLELELYDLGTEVEVAEPPAAEVVDMTDTLLEESD